jgi:hypothetical protein
MVSSNPQFAKCIHEKPNSPFFVDFGNVAIDRNVIGNDEIPLISSLVDDISKICVYESIKW